MEVDLAKIFEELLEKHSEIIPDFWSEVDSENLYAACKRDYREFSRLQKDIPKEELSEAVSEKIGHYQDEISKHKKRFIEARVKAGDEGQRVLIKQEDGTLSHASKINRNEYEGTYRLYVSELSIKIDFLKSLFNEPKPSPQPLTFEGLFKEPKYLGFTIDAMKDDEEHSAILNDKEAAILSGQAVVAPVWALVKALFYRKWVNDRIRKKQAYDIICQRFGFPPSNRPDKSEKNSDGVFTDYLEKFKALFLEYSNK